jgi:hypothetical protein
MKRLMSLTEWAQTAQHGDSVVYHVGGSAGGDVCREAMQLHDAGLVALVQRRKSRGLFEYIAQRTRQAARRV